MQSPRIIPLGLTAMVLCSYWMVLAGGQTCSLSGNLLLHVSCSGNRLYIANYRHNLKTCILSVNVVGHIYSMHAQLFNPFLDLVLLAFSYEHESVSTIQFL